MPVLVIAHQVGHVPIPSHNSIHLRLGKHIIMEEHLEDFYEDFVPDLTPSQPCDKYFQFLDEIHDVGF